MYTFYTFLIVLQLNISRFGIEVYDVSATARYMVQHLLMRRFQKQTQCMPFPATFRREVSQATICFQLAIKFNRCPLGLPSDNIVCPPVSEVIFYNMNPSYCNVFAEFLFQVVVTSPITLLIMVPACRNSKFVASNYAIACSTHAWSYNR